MKIYHLKTCDRCKKAIKALADQQPELHELRDVPVGEAVLRDWLDQVGAETLLNTRSTTWRGLSEEERKAEPLDLLKSHPTLIKRPVIERDGKIEVGWKPD